MSYQPHESFIKRLHELDSKLGAMFNGEHVVLTYKRATGQPVPIWTVRGDDGEFRIPDQRDIEVLQEADMTKQSMTDRLDKTSKYMQDVRDAREKDRRDAIYDMTLDSKKQLSRAYGKINSPGGKGDNRRYPIPKPKGKVF
ncbi:MAG: hypothetical protein KAV87_28130 [Desulfobacteraceae bacterium]|nr:hypothetical protein [Desulfobacteraceae bacterium]